MSFVTGQTVRQIRRKKAVPTNPVDVVKWVSADGNFISLRDDPTLAVIDACMFESAETAP